MRPIALGLSALALAAAALTLTVAPASAAWKEYRYDDLGIAKEFPADPKVETSTYKTGVIGMPSPSHVFTVEQDDVKYVMTVVDLMDKQERGASIMGECISLAEGEGKPVTDMEARVQGGVNAVYGRIVSTDLKNGSREMTECLFTRGRLYKVVAVIAPTNADYPNSSEAIRFINSLSFYAPGTKPPAE